MNFMPHIEAQPGGPHESVAIIGAGPAGLTAAYELQKHSARHRPIVLEASGIVGGIARTECYKGYRVDIGGHRFFTKVEAVEALWREVLGDQFVTRPRMSRIFYRGRYYSYPLKIFNALYNIGPVEAVRVFMSYVYRRLRPNPVEDNFEQWVVNRFGERLFLHFFKSYTEKVWGIPCTEIRADWAAQRIKNLSLSKAVLNALTGANDTSSLIDSFEYPPLGPGMMWEAFHDRVVAQGGEVRFDSPVVRVAHDGDRIDSLDYRDVTGATRTLSADHYISTMALTDLIAAMDPPAPRAVREAAGRLRYREFLIVVLILDKPDPFPDNWIYVHSPDVKVGRIQNFRSWSEAMVPHPDRSSIGMEYFCHEGDGLWSSPDEELIARGMRELEQLGLADSAHVVDGVVIRQAKAYPVYDSEYSDALQVVRDWLAGFANFQTVGRNGMHRYNNQDHSMLTAMLAVRRILGEEHDLWNVNVERSYHEEFETAKPQVAAE